MLEPLSRATLADQASRALKRLILERQLLPGSQLPSERELTELLAVSRTVVREALHKLVADGLLVKEASRGVFVREFDASHLWEATESEIIPSTHARGLLEVRAALEIGALSLVAQRIAPTELARLEAIVAEMRARLEAHLPIVEEDQAFHTILAEATYNPTFVYFRRLIQDAILTSTQSLATHYVRPMDRNTVETAEGIAAALRQRDVDEAQRAMRAHLLVERPLEHARLILFLDEEAITQRHNVSLRLMPAHKFPHNPVLTADHPWEGESVAPSATVLHDADQMLYQLWYYGLRQLSPREQLSSLCFATSMDGVHWTKPKLGVSAPRGFGENNLVMPWGDPQRGDVLSATILPKATGPNRLHYEMVYLTTGVYPSGVWHASSPDGLHWQSVPEQPVDVGGAVPVGDALYCMAEPEADRFAAYYRLPLRLAAQATIGRMESHDLRHWSGHRTILTTDAQDPPDAELYGMTPFRYGSLTLAILWVHRRATQTGELQLACSRDGITWTRLGDRQPLLASDEPGSFDPHALTHATVPIVVGNELWFYYAGARQPSLWNVRASPACC